MTFKKRYDTGGGKRKDGGSSGRRIRATVIFGY